MDYMRGIFGGGQGQGGQQGDFFQGLMNNGQARQQALSNTFNNVVSDAGNQTQLNSQPALNQQAIYNGPQASSSIPIGQQPAQPTTQPAQSTPTDFNTLLANMRQQRTQQMNQQKNPTISPQQAAAQNAQLNASMGANGPGFDTSVNYWNLYGTSPQQQAQDFGQIKWGQNGQVQGSIGNLANYQVSGTPIGLSQPTPTMTSGGTSSGTGYWRPNYVPRDNMPTYTQTPQLTLNNQPQYASATGGTTNNPLGVGGSSGTSYYHAPTTGTQPTQGVPRSPYMRYV